MGGACKACDLFCHMCACKSYGANSQLLSWREGHLRCQEYCLNKENPPAKTNFKAPTINTDKINQSLRSLTNIEVSASQSRTLSSAQRSALQRYGDQLNRRLNRAWQKPASLVGVRLVVTVVFEVSSSGRIFNVRLQPASGNVAFDRSVKAAFASVGSAGVTPTGQGHRFTMSFKMVE